MTAEARGTKQTTAGDHLNDCTRVASPPNVGGGRAWAMRSPPQALRYTSGPAATCSNETRSCWMPLQGNHSYAWARRTHARPCQITPHGARIDISPPANGQRDSARLALASARLAAIHLASGSRDHGGRDGLLRCSAVREQQLRVVVQCAHYTHYGGQSRLCIGYGRIIVFSEGRARATGCMRSTGVSSIHDQLCSARCGCRAWRRL